MFYNRFRYYDPKSACYLSTDPIGLDGGHNNYAYVPNPTGWIDPFGLAICPLITRGKNGEILSAKARVRPEDIGTGTGINRSSRAYATSMGNIGDDAGHILGKVLGGQGGIGNVFSQLPKINRGRYNVFEQSVKDYINKNGTVDITWKFEYGNGGTRATRIMYDVKQNGQTVLYGVFNN